MKVNKRGVSIMNEREKIIRLWFDMWLYQKDMGIDDIFAEDVLYTESWCPQYSNRKTLVSGVEYPWKGGSLGNQAIFP